GDRAPCPRGGDDPPARGASGRKARALTGVHFPARRLQTGRSPPRHVMCRCPGPRGAPSQRSSSSRWRCRPCPSPSPPPVPGRPRRARPWPKQTRRWTRTPHAGDLITFPQHVGIVETVYANHTLTTIEGNAGNAVRRRWRRWGEATGYVRVATGPAAAPVAAPAPAPKPSAPQPAKKAPARPLVARITAYPGLTIAPGQTISFTSNDSSGDIVRSAWD